MCAVLPTMPSAALIFAKAPVPALMHDCNSDRYPHLQGDILEDIALIENLEETKRTAVDIAEKVKQAKETELSIGKAREVYRPVATRGSLVYFLIDTLNALDRCYHYSMANFVFILRKGEHSCIIVLCSALALCLWSGLLILQDATHQAVRTSHRYSRQRLLQTCVGWLLLSANVTAMDLGVSCHIAVQTLC